jgi:hypothetical protein
MDDVPAELPGDVVETRLALQQLAVHVLARRRHAATGRFGLRVAPGGVATPAYGADGEVVRTSGAHVVVERAGAVAAAPVTTLGAAAALAGVDLAADFRVGDDTPAMVPTDEPLAVGATAARALGAWWSFGTTLVDELVATHPAVREPTALQLWPEHFDVAGNVTAGATRANVGASPGDGFEPLPYLYVGPWTGDRPGDPAYWNAPFGAVLRHADLAAVAPPDRRAHALAFLRTGVDLLAGG